jgi:hypothetical protein
VGDTKVGANAKTCAGSTNNRTKNNFFMCPT